MKNEEKIVRPTFRKPVSDQAKEFDKTFNKTMNINGVNLTEVDGMLNEKEQSLKKKIFSLAKMESLVFSDPKLSAVYDEMAENGEEKYGYHYNETIMNMIFNDYVLNSPKYLQKYKMAIPKEKKRRDKSGINQLKKTGAEKMKKSNPKQNMMENNEEPTKVMFLVNNNELFAYFPEEIHNGEYRTGYSHIGQHSAVHPEYAEESREATPEEYQDLKNELEGIGYNLDILNTTNETTGAASAGAFAPALGFKKEVAETTTSASSGAYVGPAAWGDGDLKKGTKGAAMRKPIWQGGKIIQETNYLIDSSGFEKYLNKLNEESNINEKPMKKNSKKMNEAYSPDMITTKEDLKRFVQTLKERTGKGLTKEHIPMLADEALYVIAIQLANKLLPVSWDELGDTNSMWDYIDRNGHMKYNDLVAAVKEAVNDRLAEDDMNLDMFEETDLNSKTNDDSIIIYIENYPYYLNKIDSTHFFMSNTPDVKGMAFHIGQFNGDPWYDDIRSWLIGKSSPDGKKYSRLDEKAKSKSQQRFMGMVRGVQKGELNPNEVGNSVTKAAKTMSGDDVEDFASTKHKGLPNKVDENPLTTLAAPAATGFGQAIGNRVADKLLTELSMYDAVEYVSDRKDEEPFMLGGNKWQFVNAKYPDGKIDIGVYRFGQDIVYDYEKWRDAMNINETESSMIDDNPTTMANKTGIGSMGTGNVPTGTNDMNESLGLLEELNNELDAYSIHHNKLKRMAEDRKPSALVLKDRLGAENKTNFKNDMKKSDTKDVINMEKDLMWKDEQTDVGDDPQKLGNDIEKEALKKTKGEAFENVGNSTNKKGNEVPKRNLTTKEQEEVNMYRNGQHSWVYDNEPSERFEERMKKDMGDDVYKMRQDQMKFKAKAPMYNKDTQPVEDGIEKSQFDKEKSGWNEREGIEESMITGRYHDILNKRRLIDFTLNEAKLVDDSKIEDLFELDFTGLGNSYNSKTENYKVKVNETITKAIDEHKFFTDGKSVFFTKTKKQGLNENVDSKKPVVNEHVDKMKHLLGYRPDSFTNTTNIKKNRGF